MKTFTRILLLAFLGLLPLMVYAEDIEIYMDPVPPEGAEPLVMFSIDYRPNLGSSVADYTDFFAERLTLGYDDPDLPAGNWTFFDVLRLSLKVVFQDVSGVKVGLMLNHDNSNNCEGPENAVPRCSNGGYIAMGFESLQTGDLNGAKAKFQSILSAIPVPQGNLAHPHQGKEMFFELYRYLIGGEVYNGRNGYLDYAGDQNTSLDDEFPGAAWDSSIITYDRTEGSGSNAYDVYKYASPLTTGTECTRLFTINFMFFVTNQESDSDDAIRQTTANGGMGGINLQGANNSFPTVLKYLYDADLGDGTYGTVADIDGKQNVVSYFVVDPSFINNTTTAYAQAGGTQLPLAFSQDPQELIDTLNNIFQQILSVSTTFVSASVPVNVFNRSEIVDNVYIALFQADPDAKPAWPGSLKKLKIEQDGAVVRLIDAEDRDAVAPDGRINFNALTFWTDADALPPADPDKSEIEGRDGRSVDRGGAGQRIPGYIADGPGATNAAGLRQLFTEPDTFTNGTAAVLRPLDADAATATALRPDLGVATDAEAETLLNWMRGIDVDDIDNDTVTTDARPWLLGDPLHSRPLPVNYGAREGHTSGNPDIRIVMGSNDGFLRMFRNTAADGSELGEEVWAFMPRLVMDKMSTLRTNTPLTGTSPHPYTVDGAPVVFTNDVNGNGTIDDGDRVIVYIGLRRGGRAYYAIDASDPDDPQLLWRITSDDTGFEQLGLSFSTPQVGRMRIGGVSTPILVIAGGYDTNKDIRNDAPGTDDSVGNALFVVNALTGELIWKAHGGVSTGPVSATEYTHVDMFDSFPSDPTAVDTSGDSFIDRIYVGDTGGTVWRFDVAGASTDWTASVLAYTGRHYDASVLHDRRYFHAPDFVLSKDDIGNFDAVIIGSGNRPNPLDKGSATVPENWFYMIKDRRTTSGPVPFGHVAYDHESFGDVTDNCLQADTCGETPPDLSNGWRLRLEEALGEKSLSAPFTIANTIFFTSYLPPGTSEAATCGPSEGGGILYGVSLADASSTLNFDTTDDDPDNPGEPTSRSDRTRELRSGGIPSEVVSLPPNRILLPDLSTEAIPGSMRWRMYWFEQEHGDG